MDKSIILAVAGSGKTTYIINRLEITKRYLIVTYTKNNVINIRDAIIEKFGFFPRNIKLLSYFSFLYSFCYKPILADKYKVNGIYWESPPAYTMHLSRMNIRYYISSDNRIFHNRIALLCQKIINKIKQRIEKYYDSIMIDEVQDFSGHDFNFLKDIISSNNEYLLVGDFFQHTFDTSNDGRVNCNLYKDCNCYINHFSNIRIDSTTLSNSYRCSPCICEFIRTKIGIEIYASTRKDGIVMLLEDDKEIKKIISNNNIVKLFYQSSIKYNCYSMNWGSSKGINKFNDVCVVLNKNTMNNYTKNTLFKLPSRTKNKLYVACTRSKRNLYLVDEKKLISIKKCQ